MRIMKTTAKQILKGYLNSWWLPALVFLILLGGFTLTATPNWKPVIILADILMVLAGLAVLGVFAASIWNLLKKQWAKGIINLILLLLCSVAIVFAFGFLMFGSSEDGFADRLEMPDDVEIAEPKTELYAQLGEDQDTFQTALLSALRAPGRRDRTVTGNISSLVQLHEHNPELLRRYLSANPGWRVFEERGNIVATKRWMIGPEWKFTLHGYYTRHVIDTWSKSGTPDFQSRFTIGLSGKPWWRGNKDTTWLKAGDTTKAKLSEGNQMHESHCVISADSMVVEVFEQSEAPERRLTTAALNFVEAELVHLVENPSWDTIRKILPADSIRTGEPSFDLRNSFQPGIYDSIIWVNPGEPGMIFLKAFEVTKGTPLSVDRLQEKSNEWIGWSENPEEMFFSNTHFTIYEGDWGKPYAARFEVWFTPNSGGPERKLMDNVFKIEGWQR